ncbi:hypothetical protein ABPG74_020163 [Tetrahymena malaccensis]
MRNTYLFFAISLLVIGATFFTLSKSQNQDLMGDLAPCLENYFSGDCEYAKNTCEQPVQFKIHVSHNPPNAISISKQTGCLQSGQTYQIFCDSRHGIKAQRAEQFGC